MKVGLRRAIFRTGFEALYASRGFRLAPLIAPPRGVIFTLHHVRPAASGAFAPSRLLEVTPSFLDDVIERLRAGGFDLVDLDEAARRLALEDAPPFAAFTLDDGYRDNAEHAAPIFRRHSCPFAIYVASDFAQGRGQLWWLVLEEVVARADSVSLQVAGETIEHPARNAAEKTAAYWALYWPLRRAPQSWQRIAIAKLAETHGVDMDAMCRDLVMDWQALSEIARDPLCTIGAHTIGHFALAQLDHEAALHEIVEGAARIETHLGIAPRHLSYPYGDRTSAGPREFALAREAGFVTGVTTRPGLLYAGHREHLTALPRVSLNGEFQAMRYVDVLLSGAPFLLYNRGRRLNVA